MDFAPAYAAGGRATRTPAATVDVNLTEARGGARSQPLYRLSRPAHRQYYELLDRVGPPDPSDPSSGSREPLFPVPSTPAMLLATAALGEAEAELRRRPVPLSATAPASLPPDDDERRRNSPSPPPPTTSAHWPSPLPLLLATPELAQPRPAAPQRAAAGYESGNLGFGDELGGALSRLDAAVAELERALRGLEAGVMR